MALTFYYLSGSPFSWKVWLALEHKALSYDLEVLSADAGDLRKPAFLALNPRGKVPVIVDDTYIYPQVRRLVVELLMRKDGAPDQTVIADAKATLAHELAMLDARIGNTFLAGPDVSAADYAIYPFLAVLKRVATRRPERDLGALLQPQTMAWMGRIEELRFFPTTTPPHWRAS